MSNPVDRANFILDVTDDENLSPSLQRMIDENIDAIEDAITRYQRVIVELTAEVSRLKLIETKARGLVRTASVPRPHTLDHEVRVVRTWWDSLTVALGDEHE